MRNRVILASAVALAIGLFSFNLAAQVIPRSIQEGGTDAVLREKKNAWTVRHDRGAGRARRVQLAEELGPL